MWVPYTAWMAHIIIIRNLYCYCFTKSATLDNIKEFPGDCACVVTWLGVTCFADFDIYYIYVRLCLIFKVLYNPQCRFTISLYILQYHNYAFVYIFRFLHFPECLFCCHIWFVDHIEYLFHLWFWCRKQNDRPPTSTYWHCSSKLWCYCYFIAISSVLPWQCLSTWF